MEAFHAAHIAVDNSETPSPGSDGEPTENNDECGWSGCIQKSTKKRSVGMISAEVFAENSGEQDFFEINHSLTTCSAEK